MLLHAMVLSSVLLAQGKLPKGPLPSDEESPGLGPAGTTKAESSGGTGHASEDEDGKNKGNVAIEGKSQGKAKTGKKGGQDQVGKAEAANEEAADDESASLASDSAQKSADKKKNFNRRNCFLDMAEPPGTSAFFSENGKYVWLLTVVNADGKIGKHGKAKKTPKAKPVAPKPKRDANSVRYVLYKINLGSKKGEPVLSLEHGPNATLVAYGDPPAAVSLIAFVGKTAACFEGPSVAVSLNLAGKDGDAVEIKGKFQLAYTPDGMTLVDMRKEQILQIDPQSFQTKNALKVPAFERPLFFNPQSKSLVSWYDDGGKRGLVARLSNDETEAKRLKFKRDDRMLQSGDAFAVAHLEHLPNTIEIRELKDWTRTGKPGQYTIKVPPAYSVKSAGIHVNFKKRLALVQGANYLAKTRWQRLFIYNYTMHEHLTVVPVTNTQYIHYAGINPTGRYAVVEMRDVKSRQTENVRVYDFATNNFADITFLPTKS